LKLKSRNEITTHAHRSERTAEKDQANKNHLSGKKLLTANRPHTSSRIRKTEH